MIILQLKSKLLPQYATGSGQGHELFHLPADDAVLDLIGGPPSGLTLSKGAEIRAVAAGGMQGIAGIFQKSGGVRISQWPFLSDPMRCI